MRDLDPYAWLYRVAVMIKNSKALADIALHGSIDLSAWLPEKSSDRGRFPIRGRTYPAALLTGMQTFAFFAGNLRAKPSVSRVWPLAQAR